MGQTVGILGAGQLGRMLALAGYPLGLRFRFFDPDPDSPSSQIAETFVRNYDDAEALEEFVRSVDVLTYEFENIPESALQRLQGLKPIFPPPMALRVSQDRYAEKTFLSGLGIPTAAFASIDCEADIAHALDIIGCPAVLKTRRMGYDGKGQRVVRGLDELVTACRELSGSGLILERFVSFSMECSLISVRSVSGETRYYPLIWNTHRDGILRMSRTPDATLTPELQRDAERHAALLLASTDYVGVLAIEYFVVDGKLMANEIAPRVHNSGHWTIEGAETSQFENHLRAILDLPLGSTQALGHICMLNIIGELPDTADVLRVPGAHLHLYGKSPRPNRKIGHITIRTECASDLDIAMKRLVFVR